MEYDTYTANIVIQHTAGENVIIPVVLVCAPTNSPEDILPSMTKLEGNYPNPFNPTTTIKFATKESGHVAIDIYNVKGQKVKNVS